MKITEDLGGKPMMADHEIAIIDVILSDKKPKRCLEWGSGNSTVYFTKNHPEIETWLSMEHKKDYWELLHDKIRDGVEIRVAETFEEYVTAMKNEEKFDFILVDGQWRDECIDLAFKIINDGGTILLHDAGRIESKDIMKKYKEQSVILCEGELMQKNGFYAHRGLARFYN